MKILELICDFIYHPLKYLNQSIQYLNKKIIERAERRKETVNRLMQELNPPRSKLQRAEGFMSGHIPPPPPPTTPQSFKLKKGDKMSDKLRSILSGTTSSKSTDKLIVIAAMIGEIDKSVIEEILENREINIELTWDDNTSSGAGPVPNVSVNIKN